MKELKKLAILLRALGFKVEVRHEPITFDDGTVIENIFAAVDLAGCHWDIWHEGVTFEIHFYKNKYQNSYNCHKTDTNHCHKYLINSLIRVVLLFTY